MAAEAADLWRDELGVTAFLMVGDFDEGPPDIIIEHGDETRAAVDLNLETGTYGRCRIMIDERAHTVAALYHYLGLCIGIDDELEL